MTKKYFSYIRVSTQRQGLTGTSLAEQQSAIERFAESWGLTIIKKFEERETAAKQGRPVFLDMLKQLKQHKADGVIIHKIDRSARNLKDWADLGSLIDAGIDVHFASESLDLSSRGGRLSADIQAVVASDYIRNLREETKKGIYGRLKQGLFPFPAVIGYLDSGKGKPKNVDPKTAPLVRRAYELYSSGDIGLHELSDQLYEMGLRNTQGNRISVNGLSRILHNPFYIGIVRIAKTGQTFSGRHAPIVERSLYNTVQDVLSGKTIKKSSKYFFVYRKMIRCSHCERFMTAEIQKGHIYYRCHKRDCPSRCIREEVIDSALLKELKKMQLTEAEFDDFKGILERRRASAEVDVQRKRAAIMLQQANLRERRTRLVDLYTEGSLDKETYYAKNSDLIAEEADLKFQTDNLSGLQEIQLTEQLNYFELAKSAYLSFKSAPAAERRDMAKIIFSNCATDGKKLSIKLNSPFDGFLKH